MDRQLYPDFLRTISIGRIVVFHFFSWQLLTYLPSLGIMFALGGWFMAVSLNNGSTLDVVSKRLMRLLPTWWAFALLTLIAGFFYAAGTGVPLEPTWAWLFPYQRATWNLDNPYANDAVMVTWYIAAYLWLMLLSPLLLAAYRKFTWIVVFLPIFAMLLYSHLHPYQDTLLGETFFSVLTFGGCWILGFAKADGALDALPRYLSWLAAGVFSGCAIFLTEAQGLSNNPVALSIMSFGVAMLLLSFNPDLSFLPNFSKSVIRTVNTYAVTIYLFHNILIDASFKIGEYLNVYDIGNAIGAGNYSGVIGSWVCFSILLGLLYVLVKTVGIVETHKWFPARKVVVLGKQ
jgi:hypothetical protein